MARSRMTQLHADWIGMLQPDGLVVAAPVLDDLDVYVKRPREDVVALREALPDGRLPDLQTLATLLGWPADKFMDGATHPELRVDLPDLDTTLRPDHVIADAAGEPLVLVGWLGDEGFDQAPPGPWAATHTERFERLLTATEHPIGLLVAHDGLRLVYAPAGEAPGRLTFRWPDLCTADGTVLVDALHMLLGRSALWLARPDKRLPSLLAESRSRQEQVTNDLATQVQDALAILLDGFDTANARTGGRLLADVDPEELYDGLTTVLLRLVFALYAEDRELLPMDHAVYAEHYSVAALGETLSRDRVAFGEAQTRRFGAWGRVLALTRMIFDGAHHRGLHLPPRQGDLFDPNRHPFLEGRPAASDYRQDPPDVPPVDDAVMHDVLHRLLHLDGQRISYRNLEVEQLGSVYEALMGYEVQRAATPAVQLASGVWVELGALAESEQPYLWLQDVTGERNARLRKTVPDLASFAPSGDVHADRAALRAALAPLCRKGEAPTTLPGRHYLQPGAQRRGSGSHYTPRALTEPLVRRVLEPLLGERPTPDHILGLRICDPAMGSGAFLAEVVRQLADALVEAWARHPKARPPGRRDPRVVARRQVAERCVYGVDKNPRAVMLARMSLWLITSTADLPFTFVDHNLKEGDALVGLSLEQVASFAFRPRARKQILAQTAPFRSVMGSTARLRGLIIKQQRELFHDGVTASGEARRIHAHQEDLLRTSMEEVWDERRVADLVVACGWDARRKTDVAERLTTMSAHAWGWYPNEAREPMQPAAETLRATLPMRPFHWWLEFPEVFSGKVPGFDGIVGNPPFGGKNTIVDENGAPYVKLLQQLWPHAHGAADLCAYFFLRAVNVLRPGGHFGLVASNTIKQGNTRDTGLRHLLAQGVTLRHAERDRPWPVRGVAVTVDQVVGVRGDWEGPFTLDGEAVDGIHSGLGPGEELPEPVKLVANADRCFQGSNVLGKGFVLDPDEAEALLAEDPRRAEVLRPYIGGRELNSNVPDDPADPIPHSRYVISFGDRSEEEARQWPVLMERVERLVRPERAKNKRAQYRDKWWWHAERRPGLYGAIDGLERCLQNSQVSKHLVWGFQPTDRVFAHTTNIVATVRWSDFALLQSRIHEAWARLMGSSMKTDLRYTPSTCFETFPFPRPTPAQADALRAAGEALYTARAQAMVARGEGMTAIWNHVHDPHCFDDDIEEIRRLRDAMDAAVLRAYGWDDLVPADGAELDTRTVLTRLRKLNLARAEEEAEEAGEG